MIIMIIDDFHAVHTIQDPKASSTSKAIHMATEILDIHSQISAVPLTDNLHAKVLVKREECRGGIDIKNTQQLFVAASDNLFTQYFQTSLPQQFLQFDMTNAQQCVEHLR